MCGYSDSLFLKFKKSQGESGEENNLLLQLQLSLPEGGQLVQILGRYVPRQNQKVDPGKIKTPPKSYKNDKNSLIFLDLTYNLCNNFKFYSLQGENVQIFLNFTYDLESSQ